MSIDDLICKPGIGGKNEKVKIIQPPGSRTKVSQAVLNTLSDFYGRREYNIIEWKADHDEHEKTGRINYTFTVFRDEKGNYSPDNFYGYVKLEEKTRTIGNQKVIFPPVDRREHEDYPIRQTGIVTHDPAIHPTIYILSFYPSKHQQRKGNSGKSDRDAFLRYCNEAMRFI